MANYHPIRSERKYTPDFRKLSPNAQNLAHYLLDCRHRNSEGMFILPPAYVHFDTGQDLELVELAFEELKAAGRIDYDEVSMVVLDRTALEHWRPKGPKQLQGGINALLRLPESPRVRQMMDELLELARVHAPEFHDAMKGEFYGVDGIPWYSNTPLETVSERVSSRVGDTASRDAAREELEPRAEGDFSGNGSSLSETSSTS